MALNKSLKLFFLICVLLVFGFIWQRISGDSATFVLKRTFTEHRDVIREHIVSDVEIDRRSIVLAAKELLQEREPAVPTTRHVICPYFDGGLGNMLFQYASAYGIGRTVGLDVLVKSSSELFQIFDIWAQVSSEKTVCSKAKILKEKHSGIYEYSYMSVRPDADYVAKRYLQSWRYFELYKDDIRKQLRFRGDIERQAHDIITTALTKKYGKRNYSSRTLVGVHVRRGNLLNKHEKKYGYLVADKSYIEKALGFFRKRHHDVTFLVCSNDMKWSKANVTGSDIIFMEGNAREIDIAILSSLNHTIVTVGTFGWWSAWLANGTTLYYKNFMRNGSEFADEFQPNQLDYLYPGWIGM